jgi:hypothetical protein
LRNGRGFLKTETGISIQHVGEPRGADAKERNLEETEKKLVEAIQVVMETNREMDEDEPIGAEIVRTLPEMGI